MPRPKCLGTAAGEPCCFRRGGRGQAAQAQSGRIRCCFCDPAYMNSLCVDNHYATMQALKSFTGEIFEKAFAAVPDDQKVFSNSRLLNPVGAPAWPTNGASSRCRCEAGKRKRTAVSQYASSATLPLWRRSARLMPASTAFGQLKRMQPLAMKNAIKDRLPANAKARFEDLIADEIVAAAVVEDEEPPAAMPLRAVRRRLRGKQLPSAAY